MPIKVTSSGIVRLVIVFSSRNKDAPLQRGFDSIFEKTILHHVFISVISILVSFEQPLKAYSPIDVTPSGIVILVRLEQSENAEEPIDVTLSGIATFVKLVQL